MSTTEATKVTEQPVKKSNPRPIHSEALRISEIAKSAFTFKDGEAIPEDGLYEKTLPETLTKEVCDMVSNHNRHYAVGVARGFGLAAVDHLAANTGLEKVTTVVPMAEGDSVEISTPRERRTVNHLTGNGEVTTRYAAMTVAVKTGGVSSSGGDMKKVLNEVSAKGKDLLAG